MPLVQLQVGRFGDWLRRYLSLRGVEGAATVDTALTPVLIAEADRPEAQALKGILLGFGDTFVANGVGVASMAQLWNPAGSGKLVVVERAQGSLPSLNGWVAFLLNDTALTTNTNAAIHRDTRNRQNPGFNIGLSAEVRQQAAAAVPGASSFVWETRRSASESSELPVPVVLQPGTGLIVVADDTPQHLPFNISLQASFAWYERAMEAGEQAPIR